MISLQKRHLRTYISITLYRLIPLPLKEGRSDVFTVKTIYRAEHHGANHLEWENENTLRIENRNEYSDDSITLNIDDEIYDGWGWACQSLRMNNQYVRCLAPDK